MEIGMGIHGEPGVRRGALQPADAIADQLLTQIAADLSLTEGDRVAVLINGLGATPREELLIVYRYAHRWLGRKKITPAHVNVGEFATSLEMAGMSISILNLDDELERLLLAPAYSPFYFQRPERARGSR